MTLQSFASRLPVFASKLPVWVCKLLVISGLIPLFYLITCWAIRKVEERNLTV